MFLPFSYIVGKLIESMLMRILPEAKRPAPWDDQDRKNIGSLAIMLAMIAGAVMFVLLAITALIIYLAR